jgi:4-hydroxyphenylpyruvate dioxygenase
MPHPLLHMSDASDRAKNLMRRPANPLFLNTIVLGGSTEAKVTAVQAAGFDQIELWRQDVEAFPQGAVALKTRLETVHLGLTDYQPLLDFDGAPPNRRDAKRQEAETMLDMAVKVGAPTLLTPASTDPHCDPALVVGDMRWLARTATARGLRVAYEAMAWSSVNFTLGDVWDVVRHVNEPNLGVVVDAFHIFVRGRTAADLDGVPTAAFFSCNSPISSTVLTSSM